MAVVVYCVRCTWARSVRSGPWSWMVFCGRDMFFKKQKLKIRIGKYVYPTYATTSPRGLRFTYYFYGGGGGIGRHAGRAFGRGIEKKVGMYFFKKKKNYFTMRNICRFKPMGCIFHLRRRLTRKLQHSMGGLESSLF